MSSCEMHNLYLGALADGDLESIPAEIREALRAHLAACPACRKELARQKQVAQLFATSAAPAVSPDRWQQVWDRVDTATSGNVHQGWIATVFRRRAIKTSAPESAVGGLAAARWAAAAIAAMLTVAFLWPALKPQRPQYALLTPSDQAQSASPAYTFATVDDGDIEALETFGQEQTPAIITTGQQGVLVVWVVQEQDQETGA